MNREEDLVDHLGRPSIPIPLRQRATRSCCRLRPAPELVRFTGPEGPSSRCSFEEEPARLGGVSRETSPSSRTGKGTRGCAGRTKSLSGPHGRPGPSPEDLVRGRSADALFTARNGRTYSAVALASLRTSGAGRTPRVAPKHHPSPTGVLERRLPLRALHPDHSPSPP